MKIKVRKKRRNENKNTINFMVVMISIVIAIAVLLLASSPISTNSKNNEVKANNANDNIVGISKEEQVQVYQTNKNSMEKNLNNNVPYLFDEDLGVYLPLVDWTNDMTEIDENDVLSKNALTYPEYGSPGKGNLIVFGHNSGLYSQGYFTPFVDNLGVGDTVIVKTKTKDYKYKIESREIVKDKETDKVFYQSDEPIITIGTCDVPSATTNKRIIWTGTLEK